MNISAEAYELGYEPIVLATLNRSTGLKWTADRYHGYTAKKVINGCRYDFKVETGYTFPTGERHWCLSVTHWKANDRKVGHRAGLEDLCALLNAFPGE